MHGIRARAPNEVLLFKKDHEERHAVENEGSESLKAQMTYITGQVRKVKELLRTSCSKERIVLAAVKTLDVQ